VGALLFTAGKDREYECMMKENPGFDRRPIRTMKKRDCKHCLYYDESNRKCSLEKCVVFED